MFYFSIIGAHPEYSGFDGFEDFLIVKVRHTRTTMIKVLDILTNARKLFWGYIGGRKNLWLQNDKRQRRRYWLDLE